MEREFKDLPRLQIRLSVVKLLTAIFMVVIFFVIPCHLIDQSNFNANQGRVAGVSTQVSSATSIVSDENNYLVIGALLLIIGGILLIYLVAPSDKPKIKRYVKK